MSSAGINPLALVAPDLYAKQLSIQRRQALAQSLLEQGGADPGKAAYGGLKNAGNAILGAYLLKNSDKDMAALYAPPPAPSPQDMASQTIQQRYGMSPSQASGIMNTPTSAQPVAQGSPVTPLAQQAVPEPQISNNPNSGPVVSPVAPSQPQPQQPQGQAKTIPQAMGSIITTLPGLTPQQSMIEFFQNNQAYWTALNNSNALTDQQKQIIAAYPGDPLGQATALRGIVDKAGSINTTRGVTTMADGRQIFAPPPAPPGYQYVAGPNGQPQLVQTMGGPQAVAGSALANRVPTALTTPAIAYGSNNMPVATNALAMSGNGNLAGALGIGQPPQQPAAAPPGPPPGFNAMPFPALPQMPNRAPAAPRPSAPARPAAGGGGGLLPELPQGVPQYLQGQGKDAAERHDAIVQAAQESPMRINVLDNIINLSQSGIASGPGQDFQNKIGGLISNTPGLSMLIPQAAKDNLSQFQELQKFTYQNAIRSWQAAGGTGTDAQMESMAHANPNDALFPKALQTIAKWGKAAELAVQGKANAQDKFLAQSGQTPANQIVFENKWRNAFDPKVFQYSVMSPQEKQAFAAHELKTPQAAKAFLQKQQALRELGALP